MIFESREVNGRVRRRPLIIIIIAAVLLIILALVTATNKNPSIAENVVGTIITPIQSVASSVSNAVVSFVRGIFNTTDLDIENEQLKERIAQLEEYETQLTEVQAENERLKNLLDFVESNPEMQTISGRIVGKSPGIWVDVVLVSAGRNAGVEVDMPVISGNNLVGKVVEVGATWCKVKAIIDTDMSVSVIVQRTRDNGILKGALSTTGEDDLCDLYYLPYNTDITPGDLVITSGLGGIYPAGLVVGEISEVSRQQDSQQRSAVVTPEVDFNHLEDVTIITGFPETEEVG
jgi:rod shape-determining protein MreC